MSHSDIKSQLWLAGRGLKSALRFATYDWTRELPLSLRVITMFGMGLQGYAIWAGLSRSLIWPIMWPSGVILYAIPVHARQPVCHRSLHRARQGFG